MDFVVDKLQFLGLNEREVKVFTSLSTFGRMNMTKIATRADVPRTTVDAIVRRLLKQGLISKEKVRGHNEYFVNTEEVANTLDWIEKRFRPNKEDEIKPEKEVEIYNDDEKNVIKSVGNEALKNISEMHSGDRVKLLFSRGHDDMEECVLRFSKYAHLAISNDMKLEVLISSHVADSLVGQGNIPIPPSADMIRLNIVPASYGIAPQDMFIFRDSMLLISTHNENREHVTQGTIVDLSKHLIEIACETGWSVDLVAWMNRDK